MEDAGTLLKEDVKEKFFRSKMFSKYVRSLHLKKGIESLKEEDVVFDQMVEDIKNRSSRVQSSATVKEILNCLVYTVEDHVGLVDEEIEREDLDSIIVEERVGGK